jgi:acyl transferase domain-containing protein
LKGNTVTKENPSAIIENGKTLHLNGNKTSSDVFSNGCNITHNIPKLFVWSAADEAALKRMSHAYTEYFNITEFAHEANAEEFTRNLAYTLSSRRSLLKSRSYVVAQSTKELQAQGPEISRGTVSRPSQPKIGFVFTGESWYSWSKTA